MTTCLIVGREAVDEINRAIRPSSPLALALAGSVRAFRLHAWGLSAPWALARPGYYLR